MYLCTNLTATATILMCSCVCMCVCVRVRAVCICKLETGKIKSSRRYPGILTGASAQLLIIEPYSESYDQFESIAQAHNTSWSRTCNIQTERTVIIISWSAIVVLLCQKRTNEKKKEYIRAHLDYVPKFSTAINKIKRISYKNNKTIKQWPKHKPTGHKNSIKIYIKKWNK